jgi:Winged helix DNA-binding domain
MGARVRRIGVDERRARLAARHHLAAGAKASGPVEVAASMVGLHGTDAASVYLAAAERMATPERELIERALYEDRKLLRILGMRRTMFVVPVDLAAVIQAACSRKVAIQQRRVTLGFLEECGIGGPDHAAWLREVEEAAVRALTELGEATAAELAVAEPRLAEQIRLARGKAYEGTQSVGSRVLLLLGAEGRVLRTRPRGSWISTQYRWSPVGTWVDGGIEDLPTGTAQVELVRRWLTAFGPGTVADLKWWTGWTVREVRTALDKLGAVEVDLHGLAGVVLSEDLGPVEPSGEPWVALLPALDPTVMGWAGRDWYLGGHGHTLFDRNGNAGPTVWVDGRIVGGWAQRPGGEVVFRLLEDVGAEAAAAVEAAAARIEAWIGSSRVTPRFRTPLERELSG